MREVLFLAFMACAASIPPNILQIVMDDVGHNDLGFANAAMITPKIDALARGGVILDRFYTFKECAPTRGSLMSGRLPFHFGYYRNPGDEGGVNLVSEHTYQHARSTAVSFGPIARHRTTRCYRRC